MIYIYIYIIDIHVYICSLDGSWTDYGTDMKKICHK